MDIAKHNKSAWDRHTYFNSNNMRILTIWHELGHDILQLAHNDEKDNKTSYDIMNSKLIEIENVGHLPMEEVPAKVEEIKTQLNEILRL